MTLEVVGAGLGRTGTASLKQALERLLGGRCYHMLEVFDRPGDTETWHAAVRGEPVDWRSFLAEFSASVDWPACAFWQELAGCNRDALILLSRRSSAQEWWASMERTIVARLQMPVPPDQPALARHRQMVLDLLERRFTPEWNVPQAAKAAYERHNELVRSKAAPGRLLEWTPGDGWSPICESLGLPVPDEAFPHENTTADFRADSGLSK